jgi:DNA-binding MarR family transcriptional regulator
MSRALPDRLDQLLGVTALAAMDRLRAAVAADPDLSEPEAGALVHLQAWPGASVGDLAGIIGRSQPATVRLVDRLVEQGLLRREAGADRRTVALALTEAGLSAADAVLAARAAALAPLLAELSPSDRTTLERLLGRVVGELAQDRPSILRTCRLCARDACASGPGCPLEHTTEPSGPQPRRPGQ